LKESEFPGRNGFARRRDLDHPVLRQYLDECLEENRRFCGESALGWSRQWEYPYLLAHLPDPKREFRILDAGSGWRFFAPALARKGFDVTACDVDRSLNRITVDGDTSTNDTVLLMANGHSGAQVLNDAHRDIFQPVLDDVLIALAKWLIKDGEGATKLVEIVVTGAGSDMEARRVADTVANSNLTKTALFGEDANWGRILAAVGRAGVAVEPEKTDIRFGPVLMVQNGMSCGTSAEVEATKVLKQSEFDITIDLKLGKGHASVFTCDFSMDYVKINADYRS